MLFLHLQDTTDTLVNALLGNRALLNCLEYSLESRNEVLRTEYDINTGLNTVYCSLFT